MNKVIKLFINDSLDQHDLTYDKEFQRALTYAIMWGNPDQVDIYVDKDKEITAHYYRNDKHYFTMGGILTNGVYSFHS